MRKSLLAGLLLCVFGVLCGPVGAAWGAGDATEAFCPNEGLPGFVTSLPDCRAYEMVSPPFKDGQGIISPAAVSSDGSRVLASGGFGVFAGAEGNSGTEGGFYMFTRTASGWGVSPVTPPSSLFAYSEFAAASSDLSRVLFGVRAASQSLYAEDLYVREPDGSFVEVGPKYPPSLVGGPPSGAYTQIGAFAADGKYAGASADLSHVLFQIQPSPTSNLSVTPFWPGDTTGSNQSVGDLYEYVGRDNTRPSLVGLNGQGRLISDCGTRLGSYTGTVSGDVYNAVSSDGGAVFFTAVGEGYCAPAFLQAGAVAPAVNELWARLGGIESVPISEPSPVQCEACDAGAVKEPAVFAGASQDGSKAFFLTEQELFAGDRGMNMYEYDFDDPLGKKIVRVSIGSEEPEVQGVARVSEDGTHVYFVAKGVLSGANAEGNEPVPGGENLYVFERDAVYPAGRVAFVATLSPADLQDWESRDEVRPVQVTPDGRFAVFQSVADLTAGDTSSEPQVFEYDALAERLVRVSTGQAGYASGLANANTHSSEIPTQNYTSFTNGFQPARATTDLAVSAVVEGGQVVSRVVFSSGGALTPGAEVAAGAGASSVYEYRSVGSIANGSVYLISDGTNKQTTYVDGLDASGADVFFGTADPLLAQDIDTNYDVYDARSGGGFPAPVAPAGCEGEGCQGAPSVGPSFGVAGSVGAVAGGNLPPLAAPGPVTPSPKKLKPKKPKAKRRHHTVKHTKKKKGKSVNSRGLVVDVKGRG
jgi:hypothetical protein